MQLTRKFPELIPFLQGLVGEGQRLLSPSPLFYHPLSSSCPLDSLIMSPGGRLRRWA